MKLTSTFIFLWRENREFSLSEDNKLLAASYSMYLHLYSNFPRLAPLGKVKYPAKERKKRNGKENQINTMLIILDACIGGEITNVGLITFGMYLPMIVLYYIQVPSSLQSIKMDTVKKWLDGDAPALCLPFNSFPILPLSPWGVMPCVTDLRTYRTYSLQLSFVVHSTPNQPGSCMCIGSSIHSCAHINT